MATIEGVVLDGLDLNAGTYRLLELAAPAPKKRYEWATGADADGAALVRDPLFENREITAKVQVVAATRDAGLAAIGAIIDKLEEAEKHPEGLDLVWTPSAGTKSGTFKVLSGEITDLPVDWQSGYFSLAPTITVVMTCQPFMRGQEVLTSAVSSATPFVTLTIPNVPGDVPAEGRLIVTDSASQTRRFMEWGLEQRYYDPAAPIVVDSDSMTVTGTAGTQTTRAGAYDPDATGNSVIRATLNRGLVSVCATGNLPHVGTFNVKARVYASSSTVSVRLSWQEGDGPFRANPYVTVPVAGAFAEINLGQISIPPKDAGTQRWSGRVEAHAEVAGDTLDVDYLLLVPAGEGYGKVRAVGPVASASISGYDDFTTLGSGAALNLRAAPSGGSWATSGATTDFTGVTTGGGTQAVVRRSTASDANRRFAILGTTNYTDTQVEVYGQTTGWSGAQLAMGVIARWTDANNYLTVQILSTLPATSNFTITQVVAGVSTALARGSLIPSPNTQYGIRLIAYATGVVVAELRINAPSYAAPSQVIRGSSSSLATGGALASGKPGFLDINSSATAYTRDYDWFSAAVPTPEPIAIYSGRSLEVRSDTTIRADSTNTYWGPVPAYRGSRFKLPPAGPANRTSRIVVKAHRQDIETSDAANVTDSLTVQAAYTPRYLVVPR